ncbi:DNA-directed RNA polymerases I and III subunit RPAC2 [Acrasis kona]|uniref:DNA-directed RNA polymerases I and III subunit RPAC2 n=1 Tax=Acrasis kona TaxID=1008807 RepID=A0AAW2Z0B4_9EUKA
MSDSEDYDDDVAAVGEDEQEEVVEKDQDDKMNTQQDEAQEDAALLEEEEEEVESQDTAMEENKQSKSKKKPNLSNITAKIDVLDGPDASVATFIFHNESHTMGNSVRHMLMKNKKVSFCGYTVPHPLEAKMQLRLQCNDGYNAHDTLIESLGDLMHVTEHIMNTFNTRIQEFEE